MTTRCTWATDKDEIYQRYHDTEWGVPVHDDRVHFEFLILEGAQAGLSWETILKRRDGYRQSFANFDPAIVANYDEQKIQEILQFEGVIRNKLKIRSAVSNAQLFVDIQKEFGSFDDYVWRFVDHHPIQNTWKNMEQVPITTKESDTLSKDLKKRGFKFVGSTIMYAYMQACGLVNDHTTDCFRHSELYIS
jgi:DNA-3-methyladenine glycosylase I